MFLVAARQVQLAELTNSNSLMLPEMATKGTIIREAKTLISAKYNWSQSTAENYKSDAGHHHYGKYASIRKTLDYAYHSNYTTERQLTQDTIVDSLLNNTWIKESNGKVCSTSNEPWIVFTAGCMGAGKSWTIRHIAENGDFPLQAFVTVDPDEARRHLPEFERYTQLEPERAGEWTRKEAGFLSEILTLAALDKGHNVLVDGSLRDSSWYQSYFRRLRRDYAPVKIGILHITAPPGVIYARAASRALETGRVVPRATLEESMHQVPLSVEQLAPVTDFYAQLHNSEESLKIETPGVSWKSFREAWVQSCGDRSPACRRLAQEEPSCPTSKL
jgi:predicted kinase